MILESTLRDLFNSAVEAFPQTQKRQHSTDTIKIPQLRWLPFLGTKTLFLRGLADNYAGDGREYRPIILFKNVIYHENNLQNTVAINTENDTIYYVEPLRETQNDVLVRCDCGDFKWRFCHYNKIDTSLYGRDRKRYESLGLRGPINPTQSPGLCKHLMKMMYALRDSGILRE